MGQGLGLGRAQPKPGLFWNGPAWAWLFQVRPITNNLISNLKCKRGVVHSNGFLRINGQQFSVSRWSLGEWVGCFFHRFLPKAWNIILSDLQSCKDLPRGLKMNDRWPPTEFVYFWQKSIISFPKMTSQQPHYLLELSRVWWPLLLYLTKQYTFLKFTVLSTACSTTYPDTKNVFMVSKSFTQSFN